MTQKENGIILDWSDKIMSRDREYAETLAALYELYFKHGGGDRKPNPDEALQYLFTSEAEGVSMKALALYVKCTVIRGQMSAVEEFGWHMANATGKPWQLKKNVSPTATQWRYKQGLPFDAVALPMAPGNDDDLPF